MNTKNTSPGIRETLRQTLREGYGIQGSVSRLPGENLNYLVQAEDGRKYIAKIAGKETPPELVDMEHAALQHAVEAGSSLLLPQIVLNRNGNYETGIKFHNIFCNRLRVLNYIVGTNLSEKPDISAELRFHLGESLARFDQAMADFDHPAAHRKHRWNLVDALQHQAKTVLLEDSSRRKILTWAFEQMANCASPFLARLEWQFIHGDANPENIRVEGERVVGLLDFGDSCYNPAVCDLAICLAYQMMDPADPWAAAGQVIGGYEKVRPLSSMERLVLLPLVCGRLAVTTSVAAERRHIDPENTNWFVSEHSAWQLLSQLHSSGRTRFLNE